MQATAAFGPLLRGFRQLAQLSQQTLAEQAQVSARHLSFLETGRAAPSREMVLALGNALDLPLRERNALLAAAGYAHVYRESALDAERMLHVRRALGHVLAQQEPYGALVFDRRYDVLQLNGGAQRLLGRFLLDPGEPRIARNALHAFFHPRGMRPFVVEWEQAAAAVVQRLHRECRGPGGEELRELLHELLAYPDVPRSFALPDMAAAAEPFLALHLRRDGVDVRLFTIIGTLGTPIDVTAQELRIESYFPADDASDAFIRSLQA